MKYILSLSLTIFMVSVLFGQTEKERPQQFDIPGDISVDVGLTFLTNSEEFLQSKVWPSRTVGLHYMYTHKLADRFTINPAIGFGMDRIGIEDNVNFFRDSTYTYQLDTLEDLALTKNLLTFTYLEIPVELRFYPFKTVNGEGLFVGIGGFAGIRMGGQTKIKYDWENRSRVERHKADFGLNNFRYGLQAHIGWKQFSVFAKYYLNDMFETPPAGANPRQLTFGLNFTGF